MRRTKIRLGKQAPDGYEYSTSLNLTKDLFEQVEGFQREEELREALNKKKETLKMTIKEFSGIRKKDSLSYYYAIGRSLRFVEESPFKKAEQYSLFRLIYELCPEILPHIADPKVASKHIAAMFHLGGIDRADLNKASWAQWYEITKFKKLFGKRKSYKRILELVKNIKLSGPELRKLIKGST